MHYVLAANAFVALLMSVNTAAADSIKKFCIEFCTVSRDFWLRQIRSSEPFNQPIVKAFVLPSVPSTQVSSAFIDIPPNPNPVSGMIVDVATIYFMCEEDNRSIVRIGASYDIEGELAEVQKHHYKKIVILYSYLSNTPQNELDLLYEQYANMRLRGDWFLLAIERP